MDIYTIELAFYYHVGTMCVSFDRSYFQFHCGVSEKCGKEIEKSCQEHARDRNINKYFMVKSYKNCCKISP